MKYAIWFTVGALVFTFLCWHGQPRKTHTQLVQERIEQIVEKFKREQREKDFCAITAIYAP